MLWRLFVVIFAFSLCNNERTALGEVVGAFVMPHGGIALDPTQFPSDNATLVEQAWRLHDACLDVAKVVSQLSPDVVLVSTPHGIADLKSFVFYLNENAYGKADTDNCRCPPCCHDIAVSMDAELARKLTDYLQARTPNVSGLSAFGPPSKNSQTFPLMWGEVIPLHFTLGSTGLNKTTDVVILSQPSRRYNHSVEMIGELVKLGEDMYSYLSSQPERIAIIISGDLAHTHLKSGPYGYSPSAEPFDEACGLWADTLNGDYLTKVAAEYVDKALSCGYTGFVMLQGLLSSGYEASLQVHFLQVVLSLCRGTWAPILYANYHPSYYGMMVASFLPDGRQ
eukprot:m.16192 g.16192  ORF g.16192 m.16192 type:complete len:338 (+) comp26774_c0_seq2:831-1844(+)